VGIIVSAMVDFVMPKPGKPYIGTAKTVSTHFKPFVNSTSAVTVNNIFLFISLVYYIQKAIRAENGTPFA